MGLVRNGVYYPDEKAAALQRGATLQGIHEQNSLERQYESHAHNLIQPNNPDGTPNQDFIDYFPEDAKNHGFTPESE